MLYLQIIQEQEDDEEELCRSCDMCHVTFCHGKVTQLVPDEGHLESFQCKVVNHTHGGHLPISENEKLQNVEENK